MFDASFCRRVEAYASLALERAVETKILLITAVTLILTLLIMLNSPSLYVALAVMVVLVVLIMAVNGAAEWLPQVLEKIRDLFR